MVQNNFNEEEIIFIRNMVFSDKEKPLRLDQRDQFEKREIKIQNYKNFQSDKSLKITNGQTTIILNLNFSTRNTKIFKNNMNINTNNLLNTNSKIEKYIPNFKMSFIYREIENILISIGNFNLLLFLSLEIIEDNGNIYDLFYNAIILLFFPHDNRNPDSVLVLNIPNLSIIPLNKNGNCQFHNISQFLNCTFYKIKPNFKFKNIKCQSFGLFYTSEILRGENHLLENNIKILRDPSYQEQKSSNALFHIFYNENKDILHYEVIIGLNEKGVLKNKGIKYEMLCKIMETVLNII